MNLNNRVSHLARRTVAIFAAMLSALLVAAFGAALTPGVAAAVVGENIPQSEVLFSATGEEGTFGDSKNIPWDPSFKLIPGGEYKTEFFVKNGSEVPVELQLFAGKWSISKGTATFSTEIDGVRTDSGVLTGSSTDETAGIPLGSAPLAPGATAKVALITGMPWEAGNESQGSSISANWAIVMEETEGAGNGDGDNGENGNGGNGDGTGSLGGAGSVGSLVVGGSLGSLGLGSLGSLGRVGFGSLGSVGFAGSLVSPVVTSR